MLEIDAKTDAHTTLVNWLSKNRLSNLFTAEHKRITYYTTMFQTKEVLIGRSSVELNVPNVKKVVFEMEQGQDLKLVVRQLATRLCRPPNLKYEKPEISSRLKPSHKLLDYSEIVEKIKKILQENGINNINGIDILEPSQLKVYHKDVKAIQYKYYVDIIVKAKIHSIDDFKKAWDFGIGAKRVYGFGMVRLPEKIGNVILTEFA